MALIDYGVLIIKNNVLLTEDFLSDNHVEINGKTFSVYPKGIDVRYGDHILLDFVDTKHPFRKIMKRVDGVYFEIKPRSRHYDLLDIYIRDGEDIYHVFAGYGMDIEWKKYCKKYNYPNQIMRVLQKTKVTSKAKPIAYDAKWIFQK